MLNSNSRVARLTLVLALTAAAPALAQTPTSRTASPIIVVDVDRVVHESAAGRYATAQLKPQVDQFETRQRTLQEQFGKEEQTLSAAAQAKTLSQDVLETRLRDIRQREQTAQTELQGRQRTLQATNQSVLQQIGEAMTPIVAAVLRERGALIAVPRGAALQMAPGIDVTPDVISRLDRSLPRVNLTAPAAAR